MSTVRLAAAELSCCPSVLSTLPSGGAGGISGARGVTDAVNSSSTASLIFINSCSCSSSNLFLLPRWKILSSKVILPKVSYMTPFRQLIMALDVAKNGLPSMMGTWLVPVTPRPDEVHSTYNCKGANVH